jgi:hypothetical protein
MAEGALQGGMPYLRLLPQRLHSATWLGTNPRDQGLIGALLLVGFWGLGLRFWLAKNSIGCNDADLWQEHAKFITAHGVRFAYQHPELENMQFNHPPLMGYLSVLGLRASGSSILHFSWWMKAPGLIAEVLGAYLVWRIWLKKSALTAAWAFAAYGTSLTQIAVGGFHCNTDCGYAGLTLLAFYLAREKRAPFWAGLALAGAINVKIIPILLIPPLLSQSRSWREAVRCSFGLSFGLIPIAPFLVTAPKAVYHNMVAYNSQQLDWGIPAFLQWARDPAIFGNRLDKFTEVFVKDGRYLILGSVVAMSMLAFFRSRRFSYHVGAMAWALFLVLTPGYGVQYAVCVLPLLFAADFKRAALYSALAGVMVVLVYTARMPFIFPLHGYVQYGPFPMLAIASGVLAWGVLVGYLVTTLKKLATDRPTSATSLRRSWENADSR